MEGRTFERCALAALALAEEEHLDGRAAFLEGEPLGAELRIDLVAHGALLGLALLREDT